ncbi:tRNA 2-selenouridine synthase [Rubellimicrobium thermophilum DSM 16684]|uniref:tRNA 2-selenouridine synthase n=1 Tax=Rubellimicrobium thermophilum DSM 16684 TaxID=1123069 RepID=S9QZJ1_9RHOB|nr:tRNA 2-selenouridine(34) synthase MnmH [Rubellimicrobium thermophilum]EPX85083.1 tRNA 2-selenouridine synthase [Rubellimicrobium thermophilum DSM 16684]
MAVVFGSVGAFLAHGFDDLIDVRSPAEFAEDHVPGALNLPVLSDAERARVGTIYVQESPFLARKIGAALVARHAAAHLEGPLRDRGGGWRPLVMCWRGGMRSGSFATILRAVGWRAETVEGGYRSWRRLVQGMLYRDPLPHRLLRIDGLTGTGKTALLARLGRLGVQVLDLEALAGHRGSLLGALPGGQPSQKAFETALAAGLARLDPARPVIVEAEASKVGERALPPSLWAAMRAAPAVLVTAPPEARARFLARGYADLAADREGLEAILRRLVPLRGRATVEGWIALLREGRIEALAQALMEGHYDPAYRAARLRHPLPVLLELPMGALEEADLDRAANRIAALAETWVRAGAPDRSR